MMAAFVYFIFSQIFWNDKTSCWLMCYFWYDVRETFVKSVKSKHYRTSVLISLFLKIDCKVISRGESLLVKWMDFVPYYGKMYVKLTIYQRYRFREGFTWFHSYNENIKKSATLVSDNLTFLLSFHFGFCATCWMLESRKYLIEKSWNYANTLTWKFNLTGLPLNMQAQQNEWLPTQ